MKKPDDKKLQINFAGVGKVSTFAVPTKTGKQNKLKARCPRRYEMKDLPVAIPAKYKPTREARAQRSLKKCQLKYNE
jgi:hypothetical protein